MFPLHKKKTISTTTKYLQRKKTTSEMSDNCVRTEQIFFLVHI